jgi:hypothetical protein
MNLICFLWRHDTIESEMIAQKQRDELYERIGWMSAFAPLEKLKCKRCGAEFPYLFDNIWGVVGKPVRNISRITSNHVSWLIIDIKRIFDRDLPF